jgi:hypothetical protein
MGWVTYGSSRLIKYLLIVMPQYYYIFGELTVSAFQRYQGLGVCDRVLAMKSSSAHLTEIANCLSLCLYLSINYSPKIAFHVLLLHRSTVIDLINYIELIDAARYR